MVQRSCGTGFLLEAAKAFWMGRKVPGQDLDGYISVQAGIVGAINLAHTARTQRGADFILP
jgi:hypothetical protein